MISEFLGPLPEMLKEVGPFIKDKTFHDLVDAFSELTPKQKEVLHALCNDDGMRVRTFTDVGRDTCRSPGGVRNHYKAGIHRIQLVLAFTLAFYEGKEGVLPFSFQKLVHPAAASARKTVTERARLQAQLSELRGVLDRLTETIKQSRLKRKTLMKKCEELEERIRDLLDEEFEEYRLRGVERRDLA
jgi:hypothetical protein